MVDLLHKIQQGALFRIKININRWNGLKDVSGRNNIDSQGIFKPKQRGFFKLCMCVEKHARNKSTETLGGSHATYMSYPPYF